MMKSSTRAQKVWTTVVLLWIFLFCSIDSSWSEHKIINNATGKPFERGDLFVKIKGESVVGHTSGIKMSEAGWVDISDLFTMDLSCPLAGMSTLSDSEVYMGEFLYKWQSRYDLGWEDNSPQKTDVTIFRFPIVNVKKLITDVCLQDKIIYGHTTKIGVDCTYKSSGMELTKRVENKIEIPLMVECEDVSYTEGEKDASVEPWFYSFECPEGLFVQGTDKRIHGSVNPQERLCVPPGSSLPAIPDEREYGGGPRG